MKKMVCNFIILLFVFYSCISTKNNKEFKIKDIYAISLEMEDSLFCIQETYVTEGEIVPSLYLDDYQITGDTITMYFYVNHNRFFTQPNITGISEAEIFLCKQRENCFYKESFLGFTNEQGRLPVKILRKKQKLFFLMSYKKTHELVVFKIN